MCVTSFSVRINRHVSEAGNRLFLVSAAEAGGCDRRNYLFSGVMYRLLALPCAGMRKTRFIWSVRVPERISSFVGTATSLSEV